MLPARHDDDDDDDDDEIISSIYDICMFDIKYVISRMCDIKQLMISRMCDIIT